MDALADTIDLLDRLVAYPTVSADSNLAMIADLATRLEDVGAAVTVLQAPEGGKANLVARLGPERAGGILLSGHSDVVPVTDQDWTGDPFVLRRQGDRLLGRGTCDMKGFIAAAVVMARQYADVALTRPVHFAFTYDEEVGCLGAQALIPELRARGIEPAMAIIGEPTEMRVIEGHKGCCEYTVRFHGQAGHGSAPERGVNAVEYAARYVARLMQLRGDLMLRAPRDGMFEPPWTTLNVGRFSGGAAHNVIPERAEVDWEMRPVQPGDAEFVKTELAAFVETDLLPAMRAICPDADIATETIGEIAGLEPMNDNAARDLVIGLLGANGADLVAFGTEGGLFQSLGASVVVCGPGSIEQAHKADEFIGVDQLQSCLSLLHRLGRSEALTGVAQAGRA